MIEEVPAVYAMVFGVWSAVFIVPMVTWLKAVMPTDIPLRAPFFTVILAAGSAFGLAWCKHGYDSAIRIRRQSRGPVHARNGEDHEEKMGIQERNNQRRQRMKRISLIMVAVLILAALPASATVKIANTVTTGTKWDATQNIWGAQVMGLRDIAGRQYVFGTIEAVQKSNALSLASGIWLMRSSWLWLGVDGGLTSLWTPVYDTEPDRDWINYVMATGGALAVLRPFSTIRGGIFVKYSYPNPVRDNALNINGYQTVSSGVVFDL